MRSGLLVPEGIVLGLTAGGEGVETTNQAAYSDTIAYNLTADANTYIVAAFLYDSDAGTTGFPIASPVVGGVSATLLASFQQTSEDCGLAFYYANVTSGTSGTFSCTFANSFRQAGCFVWCITGATSGIALHDSASDQATSGTVLSSTIDAASKGVLLYAKVHRRGGSGSPTSTWNNDEDFDTVLEALQTTVSGGAETRAAPTTGETISCTESETITDAAMLAITLKAA